MKPILALALLAALGFVAAGCGATKKVDVNINHGGTRKIVVKINHGFGPPTAPSRGLQRSCI